jgi:MFS family permease
MLERLTVSQAEDGMKRAVIMVDVTRAGVELLTKRINRIISVHRVRELDENSLLFFDGPTSKGQAARPGDERARRAGREDPGTRHRRVRNCATTSTPTTGHDGSLETRWKLAVLAMFCCGWGGNQFTPLLLLYRRDGGYSAVTVDLFLGAYVIGLLPGLLLAGALSDRHGPQTGDGRGHHFVAARVTLMFGADGSGPLYAGRLATGFAVGVAMAVGTSWVKELSQAPLNPAADSGAGARRAALGLNLGFGLGAGVAGGLAQWAPWPMVLPYVVHVVLVVPLFLMRWCPETRTTPATGTLRSLLKVPAVSHRRFVRVVLPMAPWIFGSAGVAYAITPALFGDRVGSWGLAYATLLSVCCSSVLEIPRGCAPRWASRRLQLSAQFGTPGDGLRGAPSQLWPTPLLRWQRSRSSCPTLYRLPPIRLREQPRDARLMRSRRPPRSVSAVTRNGQNASGCSTTLMLPRRQS